MFTLTNGKRVKSARTLHEAMDVARKWSLRSGQVISVMHGSHTYTYVYGGSEITGKEANRLWLDQEWETTYARVM
jgi:hypothetical protein